MNNHLEHIVRTTLKDVLSEQSEKTSPGVFDDAQKGSSALTMLGY